MLFRARVKVGARARARATARAAALAAVTERHHALTALAPAAFHCCSQAPRASRRDDRRVLPVRATRASGRTWSAVWSTCSHGRCVSEHPARASCSSSFATLAAARLAPPRLRATTCTAHDVSRRPHRGASPDPGRGQATRTASVAARCCRCARRWRGGAAASPLGRLPHRSWRGPLTWLSRMAV